jgi:hypothetical protein
MAPGTTLTPAGHTDQALPPEADRMFALAQQKRLTYKNTTQFAVWAARGSTAEEVEQANMVPLPKEELARVQDLLDASGIHHRFDRERGVYATRYEASVKSLGETVREVEGTTTLSTGLLSSEKADVEGLYGPDGAGYVKLRPLRRGGEFYYRAAFARRSDGRSSVRLFHLATGKPVRVNRGALVVYPSART